MGQVVSPEDYLYYLKNNGEESEAACLELIFKECESFTEFMCRIYQVMGPRIKFSVNTSESVNGRVIFAQSEVQIYRGTIDHCLHKSHRPSSYVEILAASEFERAERIGAILWCAAHEFFHIARQHNKIKVSAHLTQRALEYDADSLAIAGLYRFFNFRAGRGMARDDLKKAVLRSFYYPIRALIGVDALNSQSAGKNHADWHVRLIYSVHKLIQLDVPNINLGITDECSAEAETLLKEVVQCEHHFLQMNAIPRPSGSQFLLGWQSSPKLINDLVMEWARVEVAVKQKSRLFQDIIESGKSVRVIEGNRAAWYQSGWKYTGKNIEGAFRPAFHNNVSANRMDYGYASPYIIPNPYWLPVGPRLHLIP